MLGHEVAEDVGAERVRHAGNGRGVLDRDGHAGEGTLVTGLNCVRGGEGAFRIDVDEGVELGLEGLDAVEAGLDELP